MSEHAPLGDSRSAVTPERENAYHGTDDDGCPAWVCWDCATEDERAEPAIGNEPLGEQCGRCRDVWWDYAEGGE